MSRTRQHTKISLGTRPFIEPGVDDVAHARELFRHLISEYAPQVMERLATHVLPHLADREKCEKALKRWAHHCHLTANDELPHWIQARPTLGWWHREPKPYIVGKLWFTSGESHPLGAREAGGGWVEPQRGYEMRMRKKAEAIGYVPVPTATLEHFRWAVRFQCGGERIKIIADRAGVHRRDVEKAVNHVLTLIGLDRRIEKHGPLPA
jgi:hypothetical protein